MMYLVRRYTDEHTPGEYGVCDSYYAVGLFDSKEKANAVMKRAEALAMETDYEEQYARCKTVIDIIEIEVNKAYEVDDQIYLGGGFYLE